MSRRIGDLSMLQKVTSKSAKRTAPSSAKAPSCDAPALLNPPIVVASAAKDIVAPVQPKRGAAHPDRALLEHCTDYAMQVAGALGAFDVDPTDGHDFACEVDSICRSRSAPSLAKATKARAKTVDGLHAKAEMVRLILRNTGGGDLLEKEEVSFLISHLDDIKRFHRATAYGTSSYKFEREA